MHGFAQGLHFSAFHNCMEVQLCKGLHVTSEVQVKSPTRIIFVILRKILQDENAELLHRLNEEEMQVKTLLNDLENERKHSKKVGKCEYYNGIQQSSASAGVQALQKEGSGHQRISGTSKSQAGASRRRERIY